MKTPATPLAFASGLVAGSGAVIEVAAGLIFRQGQLLITQRRPGDHLGGLWEFPGGKRRPEETFEQCLERELFEELGVRVWVGELMAAITHAYPEKTVALRFFRCAWRAGEPRPIECQALAWIGPADLNRYPFPPADAQLLAELAAKPELWQEV